MGERGHWALDRGGELENALMSGLGKRDGRALIISTSAAEDSRPLSRLIDDPVPGSTSKSTGRRPASRPMIWCPSWANPDARYGIGSSQEWLVAQARRAIQGGGSALTTFRLYNRNERVSGETREVLLTVGEWLACEAGELPARSGPCFVGIDLGGSASMFTAALYWPDMGRLEAVGTFPGKPTLADRGAADGVGQRYVEMETRGEWFTLGDQAVPVSPWLVEVMKRAAGENVTALVADRYKQAELGEAMQKACVTAPVVWRGQGFRDGGEDAERFRRAAYDGLVPSAPSLLLRSAFADAVCLRDPANNIKLAKARSKGRIDAASATVLAVADGARQRARPVTRARLTWA
jgi:phage terminase large subunit-like protein